VNVSSGTGVLGLSQTNGRQMVVVVVVVVVVHPSVDMCMRAPPHTHSFNGPFSGITPVSHYQKCKTNLDFTEARDNEWQWHQLCHMQLCTLLQTDNHASTPPLCYFTGRMPFLPPNQQRQRTEGTACVP